MNRETVTSNVFSHSLPPPARTADISRAQRSTLALKFLYTTDIYQL